MEMKFVNEKGYSFTIKENEINGITGTHQEEVVSTIYLKKNQKGKVYINDEVLTSEERLKFKNKISIVEEEMDSFQLQQKVYECMYLELQRRRLELMDPKKKIIDSLKIVGLDITYLNRNINDLSSSEKKLLQIGMSLMTNPEVIILIEPFKKMDKIVERRIMLFLQKIKELYDKTIILVTENSNKLYPFTSHIVIEKNHKILIEGNTKEVYEKVDFLKKNRIPLPEIVEFTYLAKKTKKARIDYHRDIRDLIKDIYKHV